MSRISRAAMELLIVLAAPLVSADTQFRIRKPMRDAVPLGKGQCDIRLQITGEAEVSLRGDVVFVRTISGKGGRDDGSACSEPLPNRNVPGFTFDASGNPGEVRMISAPSRESDGQVVVRIRNSTGAKGRSHFRLTWSIPGNEHFTELRPQDNFGSRGNNTFHYSVRGRGSSAVNRSGAQRLSDATVDIDLGGHISISFRTDSGKLLNFSGSVIAAHGEMLKADVATEDSARLRGSMYLSRTPQGDIYRIALEATNGQDRLSLGWDRH